MRKVCTVCGYTVERYMKECPNCGSYDLKIIEDTPDKRLKRFR